MAGYWGRSPAAHRTCAINYAGTCSAGEKLDDAVSMASTTAARALGLADRGSIAVGNRADLLLCNNNFEPTHVVRAGEAVPADPVVGE